MSTYNLNRNGGECDTVVLVIVIVADAFLAPFLTLLLHLAPLSAVSCLPFSIHQS